MSSLAPLIYNGTPIRDRNELLNLTDAWKAAGSPANMEPWNWARKEGASFIEAVAIAHNLTVEQVIAKKRGKSGATWAHWQAGIAYAKYLSHDFHMWANQAVREKMEGANPGSIPADVLELIERTNGMCRMLAHKVTEIEKAVPALVSQSVESAIASDPRRAVGMYASTRELLDEAGALQKRRNGLNRKVGHEMRRRAVLSRPPVHLPKCPHSGVWLYPRDFAAAYMAQRGAALVAAHNDKITGQGHLFRRTKKDAAQ